MHLTIAAVGKLKSGDLENVEAEYLKRFRGPWKLGVESVKSMDALRRRSPSVRVVLDERGEQVDSKTLAGWLDAFREAGAREVEFWIGDADGFDESDRRDARRVLALSRLTLPHRIARVVLVEQLYRAVSILENHPYHRE